MTLPARQRFPLVRQRTLRTTRREPVCWVGRADQHATRPRQPHHHLKPSISCGLAGPGPRFLQVSGSVSSRSSSRFRCDEMKRRHLCAPRMRAKRWARSKHCTASSAHHVHLVRTALHVVEGRGSCLQLGRADSKAFPRQNIYSRPQRPPAVHVYVGHISGFCYRR
jgi:hypothetical protein